MGVLEDLSNAVDMVVEQRVDVVTESDWFTQKVHRAAEAEVDKVLDQVIADKVAQAMSQKPLLELCLCEQDMVILKPDQPYIFKIDYGCNGCLKILEKLGEEK